MKPILSLLAGIIALPAVSHAALVKAFEFNTPADTEGFSILNGSGLTTTGGLLTGTATSGDIQLVNTTGTYTKATGSTWTELVFRVRETTDDAIPAVVSTFSSTGLAVVLGPNANTTGTVVANNGTSGVSAIDSGDGFFTVTVDISSYSNNTIRYFRFDPIGAPDAAGNFFEVDFAQIYDSSAVPEPSATLLGVIGVIALLRRRR